MTRVGSAAERLKGSWHQGGLKQVVTDLTSYLAWRTAGSPPDATATDMAGDDRLARLESAMKVLLARDWYATARPHSSPLVSVVLPTKDRPDLLRRAVDSVLDQDYGNWELLVVDDASEPTQPPWTAEVRGRVRWLQSGGRGLGHARNHGLDNADGELIAFLDDDNSMNPHWLNAVVSTFESQPDSSSLVGAQVVFPESGSSEPPRVRYPNSFDWDTLTEYNYIDLGMLAHRRMSGLRFDESLPAFLDWDYLVRLTKDNPPILVPAISGYYFTDAPGRISYKQRRELQSSLRARFRELRQDPPTAHPGIEGVISAEDAQALSTLVGRLARQRGGVEALAIGMRPSSSMSAESSMHWHTNDLDQTLLYDLIIVDEPGDSDVADRLAPEGLLVGLHGHRVDYASKYPVLINQRRVGDTLWAGSAAAFDPEALFPGAALVKLGFDRPIDTDPA